MKIRLEGRIKKHKYAPLCEAFIISFPNVGKVVGMGEFDQEEFNKFILDSGVGRFCEEPARLASGRHSHWYQDWGLVARDPYLVDQLTEHVVAFASDVGDYDITGFHPVGEGAIPFGVAATLQWARKSESYGKGSHSLSLGRSDPKRHGSAADRMFVGCPGGRTVVLEDSTSTGSSILRTIADLREADFPVWYVLVFTDRMQATPRVNEPGYDSFESTFTRAAGTPHSVSGLSVKEIMKRAGFAYHAMSTAAELLPLMYERLGPGEELACKVEEEYKRFGAEPLKLVG